MYLQSIFFLSIVSIARTQDLAGVYQSCNDKRDLCHLNCVVPKQRTDVEMAWPINQPMTKLEVSMCVENCDITRKDCVDSDEVTTINSCIMDCARRYDTGMKKCVSQVSSTKRSTFGENLDSCAIKASAKMDVCKDDCIGIEDYKLNGWQFPDGMEDVKDKYTAYKNLAYED